MKSKRIAEIDRRIGQFHRFIVFSFGVCCLSLSLPELAHAFASAEWAIGELCAHMEGNLGALLMSAAGIGAVISAAFGNFRASYSFIIVGIGAFSVSAMLSLYFPQAADTCSQGSQGGGGGGGGGAAAAPGGGSGGAGGGGAGGGGGGAADPFDAI